MSSRCRSLASASGGRRIAARFTPRLSRLELARDKPGPQQRSAAGEKRPQTSGAITGHAGDSAGRVTACWRAAGRPVWTDCAALRQHARPSARSARELRRFTGRTSKPAADPRNSQTRDSLLARGWPRSMRGICATKARAAQRAQRAGASNLPKHAYALLRALWRVRT